MPRAGGARGGGFLGQAIQLKRGEMPPDTTGNASQREGVSDEQNDPQRGEGTCPRACSM